MTQQGTTTVSLKVSPQVARIVKPGAPRDAQLAAARGALPLAAKDLLTVLFFLCASKDVEIRQETVKTLRELPVSMLAPLLKDDSLPAQLLELLVRVRLADADLMGAVIMHPAISRNAILHLAQKGGREVLERLAGHQALLMRHPEVVAAIIANPAAEKVLKYRLGWREPEPEPEPPAATDDVEADNEAIGDEVVDDGGRSQTEIEQLMQTAEQEGLSKYQIAMELKVSEKIKMGLTGDKEWRSILLKESNKLIQGAVLKNPRITDGEVLMIAKSRTSSDEMIRLILFNKDWLKNYEIKKALIIHPKTPPPKALRFISSLTMKDLKNLVKSRQVSNIVSTSARKELEQRLKKGGG